MILEGAINYFNLIKRLQMGECLYISKSGRLRRKGNALYFSGSGISKSIPVVQKKEIYLFGEITFNTKLLNFLSQKKILLHVFNYYGFYSGSYYPVEHFVSGNLLIKQVEAYQDKRKRLLLAKSFIEGAIFNIRKNLIKYKRTNPSLEEYISKIDTYYKQLEDIMNVSSLMGLEANVRKIYYDSYKEFLGERYQLKKRVIRPPDNPINCLLSFGNACVYTSCLGQIYRTALNPTISYLHSPGERRFSLSLDLAEIFKPIISDRIVFSLLNNGQVSEKHFTKKLNFCHLNEEGRRIFSEAFDRKMGKTIYVERLKRKVSYRRLITLECYKLIKYLMEGKKYKPLHFDW